MKTITKLLSISILCTFVLVADAQQDNVNSNAAAAAALGLTYIQPSDCGTTSTSGDFLIRVSQVPGRNFIMCNNHGFTHDTSKIIFDAGLNDQGFPNAPWAVISEGQKTYVCRNTDLNTCGLFYSKE